MRNLVVPLLILLIAFLPVARADTQLTLETENISYLPLEIVKMRGTLTYNEGPVCAVLVSLEVKTPSCLLTCRSVATDSNGFNDSFRLPYHAEAGLWTVYASANVGDKNVSAWCQFYVLAYVLNYTENIQLVDEWLRNAVSAQLAVTIIGLTVVIALIVYFGTKKKLRNRGKI